MTYFQKWWWLGWKWCVRQNKNGQVHGSSKCFVPTFRALAIGLWTASWYWHFCGLVYQLEWIDMNKYEQVWTSTWSWQGAGGGRLCTFPLLHQEQLGAGQGGRVRLVPTCEQQRQPPKTYLLPAYYRLFVNAIIITAAKTTNGNITIIIIDRYLIDQVLSFFLAFPMLT